MSRKVSSSSTEAQEPLQKRARVTFACDYCHGKKLKCDGALPCWKCATKNLQCTYVREKHRGNSDAPLPASRKSVLRQGSTAIRPVSMEVHAGVEATLDVTTMPSSISASDPAWTHEHHFTYPAPHQAELPNTSTVSTNPSDPRTFTHLSAQYQPEIAAQSPSRDIDPSHHQTVPTITMSDSLDNPNVSLY